MSIPRSDEAQRFRFLKRHSSFLPPPTFNGLEFSFRQFGDRLLHVQAK